jgi:hypothetical protein
VSGRTYAEVQSSEGSVGPDGRYRSQDQAAQTYSDLNVLVRPTRRESNDGLSVRSVSRLVPP